MNNLIRLRPVSATTNTSEVPFSEQQLVLSINGLVDGAGIAVDRSENIYISDYSKHVIFRYKRGGTSVIFAGSYGISGLADGQGSNARFNCPSHMAVDRSGILWVIDSGNNRIRRIDQNANVFTVAAISPIGGNQIGGIAIDDSGNMFFVDNS